MAIGTFEELRTAVKDWMVADDISDVAFANFVQLAEARMNRELKVRNMYAVTDAQTFATTGKDALPADFVEIVTLVLDGSPTSTVLAYIAPQQIVGLISTTYPGTPRQYTIIGNDIQVFPTPTEAAAYTMNYLRSLPALALTGTTTNWLLEKAPDLYLYATLLEAAIYLQDDAEAQRAQQLYERGKESLMAADVRSRNRPWARMIPNISGSYDSRFRIV